jgi:CheY-like chemotaxis protein
MAKLAKSQVVRSRPANAVVWNGSRTSRVANSRQTSGRTHSRRPTLLWIDDYEPGLELYRAIFESYGFRVLAASSGEAGLRLAARNHVDVVVSDYEMPKMNGEEVALEIKAVNPGTPVVIFSGSMLVSHRALRAVDACCDKAGSRDQLLATIHTLLQAKRSPALQPPPIAHASDHAQRTVA